MIEPGSPAPEFTLPDQDGNPVSLGDFAGSKLVIAFYPAAMSKVCTDQLSLYQEVSGELESRGAKLVAISVNRPEKLAEFADRDGLEMPLLSDGDPKGEVARAYGAFIEERGHTNRSLVVVDEEGTVAWSYESHPLKVPGANLIFDGLEQAA